MKQLLRLVLTLFAAVSFASCARLAPSNQAWSGDASAKPLLLRQLQVLPTDNGMRAVLLRLSRPPEGVRHSAGSRPARLIIEAIAPNSGGDLPERQMPQESAELKAVRVARKNGVLKIVLEFSGDDPPPYSVREMADWILVRLGG
jgi:hypothetical protein